MPQTTLPATLTPVDYPRLAQAHDHLETPGLAIRLSSVIGTPIEFGFKLLPRRWYRNTRRTAEKALWRGLSLAVSGLDRKQGPSSDFRYKLAGIAGGAVGGFFGGPALLLELPLTTLIILRAIADIARSEGEDLEDLETRLACLQVFAFGGHSAADDAAETRYYGLRLALEAPIAGAARHLAQFGLADRTHAPVLVGFMATVAERFGVTLSEKAAAEAIPVIGAIGGAFINSLFIQHFQDMARSHFTIRRLERQYGAATIRSHYRYLSEIAAPALCCPLAA